MIAHFEDSCLFIVLFRSPESYLIRWTLKLDTQLSLIKGNTLLLCSFTAHPPHIPSYILFSDFFFFFIIIISRHFDPVVPYDSVLGAKLRLLHLSFRNLAQSYDALRHKEAILSLLVKMHHSTANTCLFSAD